MTFYRRNFSNFSFGHYLDGSPAYSKYFRFFKRKIEVLNPNNYTWFTYRRKR